MLFEVANHHGDVKPNHHHSSSYCYNVQGLFFQRLMGKDFGEIHVCYRTVRANAHSD